MSVRGAPKYPSTHLTERSFRLEKSVDMDSARSVSVGAYCFILEERSFGVELH